MTDKRPAAKPHTEPSKEAVHDTRKLLEQSGLPSDDTAAPRDAQDNELSATDLTPSTVQPGAPLFKGSKAARPIIDNTKDQENQTDSAEDVLPK